VNNIDNSLLRPVIGVGDKIDGLFMFNAKTGAGAFFENGSSLAGRLSGD